LAFVGRCARLAADETFTELEGASLNLLDSWIIHRTAK